MAVSVKRITLWRSDVENQPGVLARTLEPLAGAGANLRLVMGYRFPSTPERSAIEVAAGGRYTAAIGFADDATATAALPVIRRAARPPAGAKRRSAPRKRTRGRRQSR